MRAPVKCDRTLVSRELFASIDAIRVHRSLRFNAKIAVLPPTQANQKNLIKLLFYVAFPEADLNPHERDGLGISSAFRPTFAASQ